MPESHGDSSAYYRQVAGYFDVESTAFEKNYRNNAILQQLRTDFRQITERYRFDSLLEIGCGTGIDLRYFAEKYPHCRIRGIDVSPAMVVESRKKLESAAGNVYVDLGTPEKLDSLVGQDRFDMIICYFGALNTVPKLNEAADALARHLTPKGTLVLTFVNRWFLFEILWNLLRLRPRRAFARLRRDWPGYAPNRPLPSRCRSASEIRRCFGHHFRLVDRRGYSIVYPAWYRHRFISVDGRLGRMLWRVDRLINKTLFWNLGEYSLYVFKPQR
ncbi:class I SAM-dependent methyltransferase [candidate division KSB1 bacterium]|nr:class I SAM-dependent methyltransferase [candidate division KSB1 bacterium]